jgi:hypothetical protein
MDRWSDADMTISFPTRKQLISAGAIAAFVYLSSVIVVMGSERVYWYWAGLTLSSIFEIAAFYAIPTAVTLWALALAPVRRFHQVVLGGAIFAFVVEGVLTPIIYADGPLPVMASLFVGWHGMLAFVGMWYLTRRWLLAGRSKVLAAAGAGFGALWGVWAFVAAVGDPANLAEVTGTVLAPVDFAVYAFGVGVVFVIAHWLIGFVWPSGWKPSRASTWVVALAAAAYFAVAVLIAVPWAPVKLSVLVGGTFWLMRRGAGQTSTDHPTMLDQLAGRVSLRGTAPLLIAPVTAATTYAAMWLISLPDAALGAGYWLLIVAQVVGGAIAYVWAGKRSLETRTNDPDAGRVPASEIEAGSPAST